MTTRLVAIYCKLSKRLNLIVSQDFVSIPVSDIFISESAVQSQSLLVLDTTQKPPVPIPIKVGDVNQDGFPDLLAIVSSGPGSQSARTPQLAYSVPCGKGVSGCTSTNSGRRGWAVLKKGGEILNSVKDAKSVAFLDVDEDVGLLHLCQLHIWKLTRMKGYLGYHGSKNG